MPHAYLRGEQRNCRAAKRHRFSSRHVDQIEHMDRFREALGLRVQVGRAIDVEIGDHLTEE